MTGNKVAGLATALLVLPVAGCVGKSKADSQAKKAYIAGQQDAMSRLAVGRKPVITFVGPVRNAAIPWVEGLTLARAMLAAEYVGPSEPRQILLVRDGQPLPLDPKQFFSGEDVPLQSGDLIQLIP